MNLENLNDCIVDRGELSLINVFTISINVVSNTSVESSTLRILDQLKLFRVCLTIFNID